jgi:hypothetical protein
MNPPFEQIIVGSWELLSTTQPGLDSEWTIHHFSRDGFFTSDFSDNKEFIYPGRYKIEDNQLIFIWESWGQENTKATLILEPNGNIKIFDKNGFATIHKKVEKLRPDTFAFIDQQGNLRKRK